MNTKTSLVLLLYTVLLVGCSSDDSELGHYIYEIKSRPAKAIEAIPEFQSPPKFAYPENDTRRSPFKPIVAERPTEDISAPNPLRPKQSLEAFPLDALKFVGVIKEGTTVWALITQPNGMVARVKAGDYMGKNYGRINSIDSNTITLEETVQTAGKWEKKIISLKLHASE